VTLTVPLPEMPLALAVAPPPSLLQPEPKGLQPEPKLRLKPPLWPIATAEAVAVLLPEVLEGLSRRSRRSTTAEAVAVLLPVLAVAVAVALPPLPPGPP
jgi:hypothetical protein